MGSAVSCGLPICPQVTTRSLSRQNASGTPLPGTQLYREKARELLTRDYTCIDALQAVVLTRLPHEEF